MNTSNQSAKFSEEEISNIEGVVEHVVTLAGKYGFKPDEDMVRGSVEESANLLGYSLSEAAVVEACDQVLAA